MNQICRNSFDKWGRWIAKIVISAWTTRKNSVWRREKSKKVVKSKNVVKSKKVVKRITRKSENISRNIIKRQFLLGSSLARAKKKRQAELKCLHCLFTVDFASDGTELNRVVRGTFCRKEAFEWRKIVLFGFFSILWNYSRNCFENAMPFENVTFWEPDAFHSFIETQCLE